MAGSLIKSAAKLAERLRVIESTRTKYVDLFRQTVTTMVKEHPFQKDQCIELELARGVARAMGVREDSVAMVELHNNWKSAEFIHSITTPMPPPPKKGMPQDPPVTTRTIFKVVAESAKLRVCYVTLDENNNPVGREIVVALHQRPDPTTISSSSSSPPKDTGGKGKGGKGKGKA